MYRKKSMIIHFQSVKEIPKQTLSVEYVFFEYSNRYTNQSLFRWLETSADIKGGKLFREAPWDLSYVGMTVQDWVGGQWGDVAWKEVKEANWNTAERRLASWRRLMRYKIASSSSSSRWRKCVVREGWEWLLWRVGGKCPHFSNICTECNWLRIGNRQQRRTAEMSRLWCYSYYSAKNRKRVSAFMFKRCNTFS